MAKKKFFLFGALGGAAAAAAAAVVVRQKSSATGMPQHAASYPEPAGPPTRAAVHEQANRPPSTPAAVPASGAAAASPPVVDAPLGDSSAAGGAGATYDHDRSDDADTGRHTGDANAREIEVSDDLANSLEPKQVESLVAAMEKVAREDHGDGEAAGKDLMFKAAAVGISLDGEDSRRIGEQLVGHGDGPLRVRSRSGEVVHGGQQLTSEPDVNRD